MEELTAVVHQLTACMPVLEGHLDQIEETSQQISCFTCGMEARLVDVEGVVCACDE